MNTAALKEYTTEASAGYLGAIKTTGSKSHKFLYGAELSKEVKNALQTVLSPDLKKSQISARVKTYTGGQHLAITLTLNKTKYAPTIDEFRSEVADRVRRCKYNWIWTLKDGQPVQVFHTEYYNMTEEERRTAEETTADQMIKWNYEAEEQHLNQYYIYEEIMLNAEGKELVQAANQIIKAYNSDDSNAMVDYFDTNFYYDIKIKWI
jgi:hypothetical protein